MSQRQALSIRRSQLGKKRCFAAWKFSVNPRKEDLRRGQPLWVALSLNSFDRLSRVNPLGRAIFIVAGQSFALDRPG